MKNKIIIIAFTLLVLVIVGQSLYFNYRLNGQRDFVEKEIQTVKDTLAAIEVREAKIINKGKASTVKATNNQKAISTKLKQDEKAIDNSTVTDSELDDFLARYDQD